MPWSPSSSQGSGQGWIKSPYRWQRKRTRSLLSNIRLVVWSLGPQSRSALVKDLHTRDGESVALQKLLVYNSNHPQSTCHGCRSWWVLEFNSIWRITCSPFLFKIHIKSGCKMECHVNLGRWRKTHLRNFESLIETPFACTRIYRAFAYIFAPDFVLGKPLATTLFILFISKWIVLRQAKWVELMSVQGHASCMNMIMNKATALTFVRSRIFESLKIFL